MSLTPEIRYARNGEVHLAYATFGAGPIDLVVVPGFVSHLEAGFEAESGEIWVSPTVPGLAVGSGIEFEDRGTYNLKGVPGDWPLYSVR